MAAADLIKFLVHDETRLHYGRDLGSDPTAMTVGNLVRGRLWLVAVPPGGAFPAPANDTRVIEVWPIRRDDGELFDPATVAAAFHTTADAQRIFANSRGPQQWSVVYILEEQPPARTI
jgi:hypothetical protein